MTSPAGGGITTWPKRASRGPASRKDARMRSDASRSTIASGLMSAAHRRSSLSPRHSVWTPRPRSRASMNSTSRIRGTLRSRTSSFVRIDAARMGSAPFLLPAAVIVPDSGTPPSITNFSIAAGAARVTAMSAQLSRDEAWSLLTEWVQSESLRRHCLAVATAMDAYARREGEDADRWYVVGLLHDMDYERFPDMDDQENGHPRSGMKELESL